MKRLIYLIGLVLFLVSCSQQSGEPARTIVVTSNAPAAIGPYSQGVLVGNTLYCSGQIAIDPESGQLVKGDIQEETRQVLKNLGAVLKAAGMDYRDVVKATVYLRDMNDYAKMNEVYAEYFSANPPARAAVQVARLPKDVGVEISLIAVKSR